MIDTRVQIEDILSVARARNESLGITGALMFNEGRFIQILEGREVDVKAVFESIRRDPRHSDVDILSIVPWGKRRFESWSMAFVGTSESARDYYADYVGRDAAGWARFQKDTLQNLMLTMMTLDRAEARE